MNFDKMKNLMEHFVNAGHAPGNSITIYKDGKNVFNYSCGYAVIENKKPMSGEEYLYLYSCSKITTVTAALQLMERGVFLLSDPLYEYIPEYKNMCVKRDNGDVEELKNPITLQNLFNMTAGFYYDFTAPGYKKAREITNGKMDTDVVTRSVAQDPLHFQPGEKFHYSSCHDVLAGFVSIVTGKKFRDYVKENIFDPLGMENSFYHVTPKIKKKMAVQYTYKTENSVTDIVEAQKNGAADNGVFVPCEGNSHILGEEYDSGGAGIISTVSDYALLATALANYGKGINGERILAPETVNLMRINTLDENQRRTFCWSQLAGYGYGLGVRTMMDKSAGGSLGNIGEFGWGGAAGASVYIDPEENLAAVYGKHCLNPREEYYQPRVRNVLYACL